MPSCSFPRQKHIFFFKEQYSQTVSNHFLRREERICDWDSYMNLVLSLTLGSFIRSIGLSLLNSKFLAL